MNIENIEAFVYVIHFNSFNKAADALFLSQTLHHGPDSVARTGAGRQALRPGGKALYADGEGEAVSSVCAADSSIL
ncbi:hypothetical protein LJK87_03060 [Paenibacillus sp. P25]|nr:hypothetical protein LJK87_03060 [Paenibacillus sp. P25]